MKIFSPNSKIFILLLFAFYGNVNAQTYTITGNVNAGALSCGTFGSNSIISIGNGTVTPSNLIMNDDLNLTLPGCSTSPLQIVVSNATIDFSTANKRLYLPEGSSISFLNGGTLNPSGGNGGGCTGNDRIYIGGIILATCQGGAGVVSFEDIIAFEGSGSTTSNSPVCVGNSINLSATPPPKGGPFTYVWYEPSISLTTSIGTGQSISIASAASGSHIYQVKMYSASLNKTMIANATVVVNPSMSTTPTVASATAQPTCTLATGTITVTQPPTSSGMKYSINGLTYTNTTGVFSSLIPGTYSVTAKNSSGCISNATSVTIKNATNTWNGSTWSNGTPPIITENIEFNSPLATYVSSTNLEGCSCQVNNSVNVIISSGFTLTLTNELKVIGGGTIAFNDGASLVQINNVNTNSGYIDYKRSTTARPTDYTYWSSPVSPMTLGELYPIGSTFYSYEASLAGEDWSPFGAGNDMVAGKGYIANRGTGIPPPGPPSSTAVDVIFTGVPNNGHYEITNVIADRSYLLGNPYPSALDAETFLSDNAGVLNGTLYFWTHNTQIGIGVSSPGTGFYAYSGNDYATYNATGGVAATQRDIDLATGLPYPNPGGGGSAPSGSAVPTGKIASGQGFFASSKASLTGSKIVFDNTMRVGVNGITGNNSQFFKSRSPKTLTKNAIEKNRIWLNLTNTQGAFKQALVGYITDATNDYDSRFDGESFDGNEFVDFYSVNQDKNLTIQGRALPFDENDEVPLGFRTVINGAFTINIDQVDGLLANQAVYIEDKLTNAVTDLKGGNYTFNTTAGTFNDRFVLRYKDNSTAKTLAAANFDTLKNKVLVSNKNKQIKINSFAETIDKVSIFDLSGRLIYQKDKVNNNELSITNLVSSHQTLVVKTSLQNGSVVTDKIIF